MFSSHRGRSALPSSLLEVRFPWDGGISPRGHSQRWVGRGLEEGLPCPRVSSLTGVWGSTGPPVHPDTCPVRVPCADWGPQGGRHWRTQPTWCPGARPPQERAWVSAEILSVVCGCFHAGCATQGTWASLHVGDASDPGSLGGGECSPGWSEPGVGTAGAALGELRTRGFHTLAVSWRAFSIQNKRHFHGSYHGPFETHSQCFCLGNRIEAPQGSGFNSKSLYLPTLEAGSGRSRVVGLVPPEASPLGVAVSCLLLSSHA